MDDPTVAVCSGEDSTVLQQTAKRQPLTKHRREKGRVITDQARGMISCFGCDRSHRNVASKPNNRYGIKTVRD